jgi:hypothetical protein
VYGFPRVHPRNEACLPLRDVGYGGLKTMDWWACIYGCGLDTRRAYC